MKRILIWIAALTMVAAAAGSPARAEMRKGAFEAGGFLYWAHFDNDSNVDDTTGGGLRFGILFAEEHQLEFTWEHSSTEDEFFDEDVDIDTFRAGYVYNVLPNKPFSPFLTVGGGWQHVQIDAFGDEATDGLIFGGGGLRIFIGRSFNIRFDGMVELIFPPSDTLFDTLLLGGVGWVTGGR
ncbi:MAG: outer membrane beta-barrel protein [Candidatus Polarisedimenticolia bacterium]